MEVKEGLSRFVEKYFLWGTKKLIGLQMFRYVDKLNIDPSRQSQGNNIKSFNFCDVINIENRATLQKYIKYLLTLTSLNIGTVKIFCCHAKAFLR